MTLADANDLAHIVGAVAVVASLVFVGLQMRQNTRAVRASMSQAHDATYQDLAGRIYASEELTKIWMKGNLSPDQMSDVERARFLLIMAAQFRFWDACFTQFREGQLPEVHWRSMERIILNMAATRACTPGGSGARRRFPPNSAPGTKTRLLPRAGICSRRSSRPERRRRTNVAFR